MFNWGKNLINGFFDDPLGSIVDALTTVINAIIYPIRDTVMWLWGEILKGIYMIWTTIASIIDTIQIIYNMMVGTAEVVWQSTSDMGKAVDGGVGALGANMSGVTNNLVLDVFLSEYVLGALIKIVILSLFLLLIFTMIAIVKIEYSTPHDYGDPKKHQATSKRPIIEQALKALLSFILIPLCCIFGVIASGVLMQALDGATSPTNSTIISNKIFAISANGANRVRTDYNFYASLSDPEHVDEQGQVDEWYDLGNDATWNPNFKGKSQNELAEYIDNLFITGTSLQQAGVVANENGEYKFKGGGDVFANFYHNNDFMSMNANSFFNTKNASQVFYFYDLHHFQWLIGFFSVFYMAGILIRITLGAAQRLFELAILFVLSPAILSMSPLDKGEAMKNWSKKFVSNVGMIYAPVVALNLYFILVAVLVQVDFTSSIGLAISKGFGSGGTEVMPTGLTAAFIQQIFNLFILIAGLKVCENSISWLGQLIGAEDIDDAGKNLRGSVSDTVKDNAAGKHLLDKGGKFKAGAMNLGSAAMGKMHDAITDRKNADLTTVMQMQNADAKWGKGIFEAQKNIEKAESNKAKAEKIKSDNEKLRDSVSDSIYDADKDKNADYKKNYEEAKAALAKRGFDEATIEARARQEAYDKTGIRSDKAEFEKYNKYSNLIDDADKQIAEENSKINSNKEEKARLEADMDANLAIDNQNIQQGVRNMTKRERRDKRISMRESAEELLTNVDIKRYNISRNAMVNSNKKNRVSKMIGGVAIDERILRGASKFRIKDNIISTIFSEGASSYSPDSSKKK